MYLSGLLQKELPLFFQYFFKLPLLIRRGWLIVTASVFCQACASGVATFDDVNAHISRSSDQIHSFHRDKTRQRLSVSARQSSAGEKRDWLKRFSSNPLLVPEAVEQQLQDHANALVRANRGSILGYPSNASIATPVLVPSTQRRPPIAALPATQTNTQTTAVELFDIEAIKAPADAMLFSLASEAGLELQINGQLNQSITLNRKQQPLAELLDALSVQAEFSWRIEQNKLQVWTGAPYGHSYPVNYLNMDRRTQSSVGLATQVGTINATAGESNSIANSSQTRIENNSEHLFWDSLRLDLQGLIERNELGNNDAHALAAGTFSINREAGLITLYAVPSIHRSLEQYLKLLHDNTQRQVLIEATVVEVALSNSFEAGVDWQVLANGINGINAAQILTGAPPVSADTVGRLASPAGLVSLVQNGSNGDVRATLSLLEQFGDVSILSRPRIIALNNQSSVLKVVDNRVYFTLNVQRRQDGEKDEIVTETEIHTVPVGLVMNVTPQISEQGNVILNVRPTLSRILGFVNDPNPELAQANVRNGVPEIQVREMESMLQVRSGHVAIIGGLMQETQSEDDARLPGLGRLPVLGHLFSRQKQSRQQTELLIVLRPTVLPHRSEVQN